MHIPPWAQLVALLAFVLFAAAGMLVQLYLLPTYERLSHAQYPEQLNEDVNERRPNDDATEGGESDV